MMGFLPLSEEHLIGNDARELEALFVASSAKNSAFPIVTTIAAEKFLGFLHTLNFSVARFAQGGPTNEKEAALKHFAEAWKASNIEMTSMLHGLDAVESALKRKQKHFWLHERKAIMPGKAVVPKHSKVIMGAEKRQVMPRAAFLLRH